MAIIEFSTVTAAVDALAVLRDFLRQSEANVQRLRWAIISGHQATQAFMTAVCAGSDGIGVLTKRGRQAPAVQAYKRALWGREHPLTGPPKNALASFMELYELIQDDSDGSRMRSYAHSRAFAPGHNDNERVGRLNDLRNDLLHFAPGWRLIDPGYAVESLLGAYSVLTFAIEECPLVTWYPHELKEAAEITLQGVNESLTRLCADYGVPRE